MNAKLDYAEVIEAVAISVLTIMSLMTVLISITSL